MSNPLPWPEQCIHFLDFEGNLRSGVLEYGVATLHRGKVVAAHTRLCAPKALILEEETAVHGLREVDLQGCPPLADDWERFSAWRQSGPLAAHSAAAENSLIKSVWPYPSSSPDFARPGEQAPEWGPWIDTAVLYPSLFPSLESVKLEQLVAATGLQHDLDLLAFEHCPEARRHFHCALYDALAGALLLGALASFDQTRELSLPRLFILGTRNKEKRESFEQGSLF